jgi:hypothetical protein
VRQVRVLVAHRALRRGLGQNERRHERGSSSAGGASTGSRPRAKPAAATAAPAAGPDDSDSDQREHRDRTAAGLRGERPGDQAGEHEGHGVQPGGRRGPASAQASAQQRHDRAEPQRRQQQALPGQLVEAVVGLRAADQLEQQAVPQTLGGQQASAAMPVRARRSSQGRTGAGSASSVLRGAEGGLGLRCGAGAGAGAGMSMRSSSDRWEATVRRPLSRSAGATVSDPVPYLSAETGAGRLGAHRAPRPQSRGACVQGLRTGSASRARHGLRSERSVERLQGDSCAKCRPGSGR